MLRTTAFRGLPLPSLTYGFNYSPLAAFSLLR